MQSLAGRSATRFVTVRFGNVLDSAGSVVQLFRQQIAGGGPVTITDPEMRRFFMTIPEASRLVIQAGVIGQSGQILVLDMGEPVRIVDLAADMIRLSGLRVGDDIAINSRDYGREKNSTKNCTFPASGSCRQSHPKIIVSDHRPPHVNDISAAIAELERLGREAPHSIADELQQVVSGYHREERQTAAQQLAAA